MSDPKNMPENASPENVSRRDFLSKAAVAGTVTIAPGVFLHTTAQASEGNRSTRKLTDEVSSENRWGMLIDTAKCADDCTACVDACNAEHGLLDGHATSEWQVIGARPIHLSTNVQVA